MIALLVALLIAAGPLAAQPALDSIVPPSPAPRGFIADGGPVLDAAALARLNARITELQRATGGDIGVAIIRDIKDRAPSDMGVAIYRAWKIGRIDSIGSARRNLGALILIVPKELSPNKRGECWITTGTGAEGDLHDADAGTICRDSIIPHLRAREYEAAIGAGIGGVAEAFTKTTIGVAPPASVGADAANGESRRRSTGFLLILGGALFSLAAIFFGFKAYRRWQRNRPRLCPNGHGEMRRLAEADDDVALDKGQITEERIGSIDYDVWECAACSSRTVIAYKGSRGFEGCPQCNYRTVQRHTRTLVPPTTMSTGLDEIDLTCANCGWHDVTQRVTPALPPPPPPGSSSSFSSGGGGGGSSFGGSGSTSGGGGGSSY